ncbi:MAG TPA: RICIN domain-containing protein [Actinospica sp.]|nr:RICIN domain-containing protein [Actinospica sp.]
MDHPTQIGHARPRPLPVRILVALAAVVAALVVPALPAHADTTSTFTPGAAWDDTSGNALQMHGLGILKVGSTWYAYGEDKAGETSSNTSFQAIPCYSSTDLQHWTFQGDALTEQSSGDLGPSRIVERPKVIYNSSTGKYVMWMHIDNTSYSEAKVGVAESSTPCGAYTYLGSSQPLGFQSRDMGLFQDTNGTAYLLSEDRANGLRIDELSSDYLSVVSAGSANGGSVALFADYEAPAMVKANGRYYILGSHLTGWATNDDVYASSTSLSSGWTSFQNFAPAGTDTYNTQVGNIIPVSGSSGTTYIYAGDRWTTSDLGDSPLIWLPMTLSGTTVNVGWQNSWSLDVTTGLSTSASSNPTSGSTYTLKNGKSSYLMDVSGGSTANGGKIIQWASNGGSNQKWTLKQVSGTSDVFTVVSVNSGLCLEVPSSSTTEGVQLDQWTCNGGTNQEWAFDPVGSYATSGDAVYQLTPLNSGYTAEDENNSTTEGSAIDQWATNGGSNQQWTLSVS